MINESIQITTNSALRLFARINLSLAITLFIILVWSSANLIAVQTEPEEEHVQSFWRFSPDKTNITVQVRISYPTDFEVDVSVINKPSWLQLKTVPITNTYLIHYFSINTNDIAKIDLEDTFNFNQIAHRGPDGKVGDFTEGSNSTTMPKDRYETITCQWDPGANSSYSETETNKYAFISSSLPEQNSGEYYTLFGKSNSNMFVDIDYYLLRPKSSGYDIWFKNSSGNGGELKLSIVQSNEVKKTVNLRNSSSFFKALTCTNLSDNVDAYAVIQYQSVDSTDDVAYKLSYYDRKEVSEKENWEDVSAIESLLPHGFIVCSFLATDNEMAVEFQINEDEAIYWDKIERDVRDKSFQSITQTSISKFGGFNGYNSLPKKSDNGKFERYVFNNLQLSNQYYIVIKDKCNLLVNSVNICARISRIKPVFLVHGIDAGPKSSEDFSSFFGELIKTNQYYNFRPYVCYDFAWDSLKKPGIMGKYIGYSSGTLGKFMSDKISNTDLKGSVIAHSMGTVVTYYQCQFNPIKFDKYINNILLAAPPFFGSASANTGEKLGLFSMFFKKTCEENFQLLSRGSASVWDRKYKALSFNSAKITVAIGTNKYITLKNGFDSTVDSLFRIRFEDFLDLDQLFDKVSDFLVDGIEAGCEIALGLLYEKGEMDLFVTSELYYKNESDSAVGTYSANMGAQNVYKDIKSYYDNKTHSQLQLFNKDNHKFIEAVKNKINDIGD